MTATGPANPPDVTVVAHDIGPIGGMERQLTTLITGLLDRGHRVTVVCRSCALAPRRHLRVVRVPGPRRPFVLAYPWFAVVGSLVTVLVRRGVLQTTGAIVLNHADVSTVHYCHRAATGRPPGRPVRRWFPLYHLNASVGALMSQGAERLCYRPSATGRLVAVSQGIAAELSRHFPAMRGRTVVIPNGVDGAAFQVPEQVRARTRSRLGIPDDTLAAIFVGSEWGRKGLSYATGAVAKTDGCHLVVVGEGDAEWHRLEAERLGAVGRVHFVGRRDNVADFYGAADVFLLPTAYEAFSLATLEAAAAGLPLLVTAVNGTDELLVDGCNGWIIRRDVDGIAGLLRRLRDEPEARREMGAASREAVRELSWERMVAGYADLYAELAGEQTGPRRGRRWPAARRRAARDLTSPEA